MNTVLKRIAFPEWCEIEVEPDDIQNNYQVYRELFNIIFKNLALLKLIRVQFLERINQEIQSVVIGTTSVRRAEVSLHIILELH